MQRTPPTVVIPSMNARYLSEDERVVIADGVAAGVGVRALARQLGRSPSTVSRELRRNRAKGGSYRPFEAERRARRRLPRPRPCKVEGLPAPVVAFVRDRFERKWSPRQISVGLQQEFPDSPEWWVSHESLYRAIYRGWIQPSPKSVAAALRRGRLARRPLTRVTAVKTRLAGLPTVHERPIDVLERLVGGAWEGDLVMGAGNRTAVATLVERKSRFLVIRRVEGPTRALWVQRDMTRFFRTLPQHLRGSLTWDRGSEMNRYAHLTSATGMPVFFCDPGRPWQRGSNENANGLIRQYLPKRIDVDHFTQLELDQIASEINERPRQVLGWKTAAQVFAELSLEEDVPPLKQNESVATVH